MKLLLNEYHEGIAEFVRRSILQKREVVSGFFKAEDPEYETRFKKQLRQYLEARGVAFASYGLFLDWYNEIEEELDA